MQWLRNCQRTILPDLAEWVAWAAWAAWICNAKRLSSLEKPRECGAFHFLQLWYVRLFRFISFAKPRSKKSSKEPIGINDIYIKFPNFRLARRLRREGHSSDRSRQYGHRK